MEISRSQLTNNGNFVVGKFTVFNYGTIYNYGKLDVTHTLLDLPYDGAGLIYNCGSIVDSNNIQGGGLNGCT